MKLLIKNIKKLINVRDESPLRPLNGGELGILPTLDDAYLVIEDGVISAYGVCSSANIPELEGQSDKVIEIELSHFPQKKFEHFQKELFLSLPPPLPFLSKQVEFSK